MIGARYRLFRLEPWLVRALIPPGQAGTYLLYRSGRPVYTGRSDEDLRNRLVTHVQAKRADYFGFTTYPDAERAFDMECALFHTLGHATTNLIHPASPKGSQRSCFICHHAKDSRFFTLPCNKSGFTAQIEVRRMHPVSTHQPAGSDLLTIPANWRKP